MIGDNIYMVRNVIQREFDEEYNEWQNVEHIPWICTVDGYHTCQRFQSRLNPYAYLNLWVVDGIAAYEDPRKQKISRSPWGLRLRRYRQFNTTFYHKIASRGEGALGAECKSFLAASFSSPTSASAWKAALHSAGRERCGGGLTETALYESVRGTPGWMLCLFFSEPLDDENAAIKLADSMQEIEGIERVLEWEQYQAISPVIHADQYRSQSSNLFY